MSKFRQIYCDFWQSSYVQEELTPEDKLFYLYLMTNPKTTQLGVYSITLKQMAFDLGYSMESVKSLMTRFEQYHKLIKYDNETKEIAILKWGKNFTNGGAPMECCVKKEFSETKNKDLVRLVLPDIKNEKMKNFIENLFEDKKQGETEETNKNNGSYDTSPGTYDDTGGIKNKNNNKNKNKIEEDKEKKNDPLGRVNFFFDSLIENHNLEINEMGKEVLMKEHYGKLVKYDMERLKAILQKILEVRFIHENMRKKNGNDRNFLVWVVKNIGLIEIDQFHDYEKKDGKKNEKFAGNSRGEPNKGWGQFN